MNPEQQPAPQPPAQGMDYLNQISTPKQENNWFKPGPRLFLMIGGALVILVIIVSIVLGIIGSNNRKPLEQLSVRLSATSTVADEWQKEIKSSSLRSLNSSLKLYLTDINRDIAAPMEKSGVDVTKPNESILQQESTETLGQRLEDARLNGIFDRVYAREMSYRLETILALMRQINATTGNNDLKVFLSKAYDSLQPAQEEFARFNTDG